MRHYSPTEEPWLAEINVLLGTEIGVRKFLPDTANADKDHFYHFKCLVYLSNTLSFFDKPEFITAGMNYSQFSMVRMRCQDWNKTRCGTNALATGNWTHSHYLMIFV